MRVYKQTTSQYWWGEFRYRNQNHRKSLKTASERDAKKRLAEWYQSVVTADQPWGVDASVALGDAINKYSVEGMVDLEHGTIRTYASSLLKVIDHFGEEIQLHEIGRAELHAYVTARRQQLVPRTSRPVSTARIRRDLNALSQVYNHCISAGIIDRNPVIDYLRVVSSKRKVGLKDSQPRERYLSLNEEVSLIAAVGTHQMLRAFVVLGIDLGLRSEELYSAEWSWIDWNRNEISVPASVAKNGKGRHIPLQPRAANVLRALPRRGGAILCKDDGSRYDSLRNVFLAACAASGIEGVTVHDLRRTCGCRLLQDHKMRLEVVSKWLGHSSVAVTARHYAFLGSEALHDALLASPKHREGGS